MGGGWWVAGEPGLLGDWGEGVGDMSDSNLPERFMVWIDAVGGFLVCTATQIVLGQAAVEGTADVPIQGELARRHAIVARHGERYVIEPLQAVQLQQHAIHAPTLLSDREELLLGPSVQLRFRQPHALSHSARLELVAGHRTVPAADGVLLFADSCVLGPSPHSHVVCRGWEQEVILFRRAGRLWCRTTQAVEVNGKRQPSITPLDHHARLSGDGFSLSIEPLEARRLGTSSAP